MNKPSKQSAVVPNKQRKAVAGDVRLLKGRLAKPRTPVSVDDMNAAVIARRSKIGRG